MESVHVPVRKFDQLNGGMSKARFEFGKYLWIEVVLPGFDWVCQRWPGQAENGVVKDEYSPGEGDGHDNKAEPQTQPTMEQSKKMHVLSRRNCLELVLIEQCDCASRSREKCVVSLCRFGLRKIGDVLFVE